MKKVALGTALALMLALVPAFLVGPAQAAVGSSTVRVINGNMAGTGSIDVWFDGVKLVDNLGLGQGIDIDVPADVPQVTACTAGSTGIDGFGICTAPSTNVGPPLFPIAIGDGGNYTLVIVGIDDPFIFTNDLSPTSLNEAHYTVHNAVAFGPDFDVCINGVKVVENLDPGDSIMVSLAAVQGATYAIFPSGAGCAASQANVNFVAGTNFVQTIAGTSQPACAGGCVQVLFVGQGTVPNEPSVEEFCNTVLDLAGVGPALQALLGNVDPTSEQTIIDTQPSSEAMQAFVNSTQVTLNAGDASAPDEIASAWATATAGLRTLLGTFQLAGFDLSNLPPSAVNQLVQGANGFDLPGVPPDLDVLGATTAITLFFTDVCLVSPTPGPTPTPTPAPPAQVVVAQPRFTG